MRKTVAIGFLGTVLDQGGGSQRRWRNWRPTISLCEQRDMPVDRLELLHAPNYARLANRVKQDLERVSPHTDVRLVPMEIRDPWDFEEVYATLHDFARAYPFDLDREDYLIHITTGTHVAQICWFLLAEARYLPARLAQTAPPQKTDEGLSGPGTMSVIDLDLSRYNRIAQRSRASATRRCRS